MGVRQGFLDGALAGSLADEAALLEGFERPADLVAVAAAAVEEGVDAVRNMVEAGIGDDSAYSGRQEEAGQSQCRHARQRELPEPHRDDHECHAHIRCSSRAPETTASSPAAITRAREPMTMR